MILTTSLVSRIAEKETSFEIIEYRTIKLAVKIANRKIINLILYDVLHTPSLHFNLISILKICRLGLTMIFSKNNIVISFSNERIAIYKVQYRGLYYIKIVGELKIFLAKLVQKPYSINN